MSGDTRIISELAASVGRDPKRLMDLVREVQSRLGCVSSESMDHIARELCIPRVEVEGVVTFYAFLSEEQKGKAVIRLSDCIACQMAGSEAVKDAFEAALGVTCGQTTPDGAITLEEAPCMGLCDQGPAALVNQIPLVNLTPGKAREVATRLRDHVGPEELVTLPSEGSTLDMVRAMVASNIQKAGDVIFAPMEPGLAIKKALALSPEAVIKEIKDSRLCGRGGAGFPAGLKWEFCRQAEGSPKYVFCNADEGEPGTFKDRVIITENPDLLCEGMTIAAFAIGAREGVIYLRAEYAYLRPHLQAVIARREAAGLLGKAIGGRQGFDFNLRIQMGAGAYVCGEESALIESAEGKRGIPRDRPPFPVQVGYLGKPTAVNNVETFCAAAHVLEHGAGAFSGGGFGRSTGTKALSVSGDCARPGIYEVAFGLTIQEFLAMVGGEGAQAVLVGGPSGCFVGEASFDRKISYEDLGTGGSMMVFGPKRDLLQVVSYFMGFFVHESCGWCVPCRVGNVLLKERVDRIRRGEGLPEDLDYLDELCATVKGVSRCGLGQTSPNPVQTTLQEFRHLYEEKLRKHDDGMAPSFNLDAALSDAVRVQGRQPVRHHEG